MLSPACLGKLIVFREKMKVASQKRAFSAPASACLPPARRPRREYPAAHRLAEARHFAAKNQTRRLFQLFVL
jgi:hypothetical protein